MAAVMSMHTGMHFPFYEGGATSSIVPKQFPCAINGHPYMQDLRLYSRRMLPVTSEPIDQSDEPGEQTLNREGPWPRSQQRWDLGAGQDFFDEKGDSSRRRWRASKGANPFDTERALCHHRTVEQVVSDTASNWQVLNTGTHIYVAYGSRIICATLADWRNGNLMALATDTTLGPVTDMATDGAFVYVACEGFGLERTPNGTTVLAAFGVLQPHLVEYVNGRLIAATAAALYEIDSTGAKAGGIDLRADTRTGARWTAIAGSPKAIFAALNINGNGETYATLLDENTGGLLPMRWAGGVQASETINCMFFYRTIMAIGTSVGLRLAIASEAGSLETLEAIEVAGGVTCIDALARYLWFSWSNFDQLSTGLGRADLATNTSELTIIPAYASDLMAVGGSVNLLAASGLTTPHHADFALTGDQGFWFAGALTDWSSGVQTLVSKYGASGQRQAKLTINATGNLIFTWSPNGTTELSATSASAVGFANGAFGYARAWIDVDNGAAGRTVTFQTSADGVIWTNLGAPVTTAGVTSVFVATGAPLRVGINGSLTEPAIGSVRHAGYFSGIPGVNAVVVANPSLIGARHLMGLTTTPNTFTDAKAKVWSFLGTSVVTSNAAVQGIVAAVGVIPGDTPTAAPFPIFAVAGLGLFRASHSYVPEFTLDTGWIRFGTLHDKIFSGVTVGTDPITGQIAVLATTSNGVGTALGASTGSGGTHHEFSDVTVRDDRAELRFISTAQDNTHAPCIRFWQLWAMVFPKRSEEISVCLLLQTNIEDLKNAKQHQHPLQEFQYLQNLRNSTTWITYQEGSTTELVRVDNVGIDEGDVTAWMQARHTDHGFWLEPKVRVRMITKES